MYGVKRYGKQFGKPDHWRFCQGSRRQCGDHPVLSAQGLVARAGQALRQHSPLWRGGCNAGALCKSAQRLGFSLDEIAELLRLDDGTHCEEASSLAEHKLKDVREKMADLARMEAVLSDLVCTCHARKGNVSCPLIASLQGRTSRQGCYSLACFI
jgi:hypothetical protein